MRLRRTLAAALVATVLSAAGAVTGLAEQSASAAPEQDASVVVAPDDGGLIRSGKGLKVSVTVTNTGTDRLGAGRLTFSLDAAPVASGAALVRALAATPPEELQGKLVSTKAVVPALDAGASQTVRATIGTDDLSTLLTRASGARLLYVQYLARSRQVVKVIKESSVVKIAAGSDASVGLGAVIPILAPKGSTGVVDVASQQTLTAPDGAWSRALRAAERDPQAAIALDPEVIASIRIAGAAAPPEVQGFLAELRGLPNEFLRLPYGDTDVTLARAAGARHSLDPTSFAGVTLAAAADAAGPTPAPTATAGSTTAAAADLTDWNWTDHELAWPVPRTASNADLARFARDGDRVLLSSDDVQDSPVRRTSGALARVDGADVVVSDATVSSLLVAASAEDQTGHAALATLVGVLATAAVTGETSAVVATVGRASDTSELASVLDLLGRQPWIRSTAISDLGSASAATALGLRSGTVASAPVTTARSLLSGEHQVEELGQAAVTGGERVTAPSRLVLLGLLSAAWRGDDGWQDAATRAESGFRDVLGMVSLAQGADSNAIGTDGTLKVTVKNTLAEPIAVVVRASASNNRLQFPVPTARVIVPAGGQNVARLNYRSISNGYTDVSLTLSTRNGAVLDRGERQFTVSAGFDAIVAIVLLVALALLLGLGVYRNIARRRQRVAAA